MPQCLRHVFCLLQSPVWPGCDCPKEPEGYVAELGPHLPRDSRQGNQPALRIPLGAIGWRRRETSSLAPEQLLLPKSWDCLSTRAATAERQLFIRGPALAGEVASVRGKL